MGSKLYSVHCMWCFFAGNLNETYCTWSRWRNLLHMIPMKELATHDPDEGTCYTWSWWRNLLHMILKKELATHDPDEGTCYTWSWWRNLLHMIPMKELATHDPYGEYLCMVLFVWGPAKGFKSVNSWFTWPTKPLETHWKLGTLKKERFTVWLMSNFAQLTHNF